MRARIAVLISGRGSNMAALLFASRAPDCPFELALVLSDKADAPGLAIARAEGVPVAAPGGDKAAFEAEADRLLREANIDFIALAGFMRILSAGFVARWEGRIVNIHPSLLPEYKGLRTHERALSDGETHAGVSVHRVTARVDDGAVLGQTRVAILPGDTPESLAERVLIAEHELYPRILAHVVAAATGPEALLDKVRELALALPRADEVTSHGMPCFGIEKGKKFAYFTRDHHGDGKTAIIVKTTGPDEAAMLIDNDPDDYYRPAYFGPSGWVGLRLDQGPVDWDRVADRLSLSWEMVAPRKLAEMFGR